VAGKSDTRRDLEYLSAKAHTPESFGRSFIAASLANAARQTDKLGESKPITFKVDVSVTPIAGIGAWVCFTIEGFQTMCTLERDDRI
jgi:hypothetical protein